MSILCVEIRDVVLKPEDTIFVATVKEVEEMTREGYSVVTDSDLGAGGEV